MPFMFHEPEIVNGYTISQRKDEDNSIVWQAVKNGIRHYTHPERKEVRRWANNH
jgi:hypothetical protein